ncbi:MAG: hypothetical protein Q9N68_03885 [Gammaproteobacteria bacterium]|nr:hypothetical protein [Gammaproteobacteria bacterium]
MRLNTGTKIILCVFLVLSLYLVISIAYHFLFFGKIKNDYFYVDGGDYYQSIEMVGSDDKVSVVVPAKVVCYKYENGYLFIVRKGIDAYEYPDYGDFVDEGVLKYYLINVFSKDIFSTFSSKEMSLKLNALGLEISCIH